MPALAHIGEMRQCLFVVLEGCASRLSLSDHRSTQKEVRRRGGPCSVQSVPLGALQPGTSRGVFPTLGPYISIAAFKAADWPLYQLTPAAKICVCAANRDPVGGSN